MLRYFGHIKCQQTIERVKLKVKVEGRRGTVGPSRMTDRDIENGQE